MIDFIIIFLKPSAVNDYQRNVFVGATNPVLGNQNSPPSCVLPAPDSPGYCLDLLFHFITFLYSHLTNYNLFPC